MGTGGCHGGVKARKDGPQGGLFFHLMVGSGFDRVLRVCLFFAFVPTDNEDEDRLIRLDVSTYRRVLCIETPTIHVRGGAG